MFFFIFAESSTPQAYEYFIILVHYSQIMKAHYLNIQELAQSVETKSVVKIKHICEI